MKKKMDLFNLEKVDMKEVKAGAAGAACGCSCFYVNAGGSNTSDNSGANNAGGLYSTKWDPSIGPYIISW